MALVVAKFFPIFHNQMISRANRLEHQSLYWGTAIVSNIFFYGLVLGAMRAGSISLQVINLFDSNLNLEWFTTYIVTILPIQEGLVFFILLFGAVVGSLKNHTNIPVPSGMAKIVIHISFLFSCFYVCIVCCSEQRKVKALRVLVMLSFMSFVYHAIMDAMSIMFLLFIEGSRASVLTFTLLYVSFVIFLVLLVSFSFLTLFRSRNTNTSFCKQLLSCFGGLCLFFTVFPAVMLMIVIHVHDNSVLTKPPRSDWYSDWTDTIYCPLRCLLVHQEEAGEGTESAQHRHRRPSIWNHQQDSEYREKGE